MEKELINTAASQGFFALLFVCLFIYVLRTNDIREKRYQKTISDLAENFGIVKEIKQDVKDLEDKIDGVLKK